jgi:16S rRNA (adenine1518-N6/adenine1519-N6)-dimethyltransferase
LGEVLADYNNIEIINNDILKVDVAELVRQNGGKALKLVANLPYYITTPIIMGILEQKLPVESITVMIQKEVALRMQAAPSTKDYGALSLAVQYYCEPYLVANVPQNCFMPRPNVDSAVIRLTPHKNPPVVAKNEQLMFKLIKVAFSQRRKTLLNCIFNSNEWGLDKEQIAALLVQSGFDERVRGETLTLEDFARLSDTLNDMNN